MNFIISLAIALGLGCGSSSPKPKSVPPTTTTTDPPRATPPTTPSRPQPPASIGSASMKPDGTIVLQLRAEGPGGMIGDALLEYAPTDPRYPGILSHLGGLKPGESKPVAPWPDTP